MKSTCTFLSNRQFWKRLDACPPISGKKFLTPRQNCAAKSGANLRSRVYAASGQTRAYRCPRTKLTQISGISGRISLKQRSRTDMRAICLLLLAAHLSAGQDFANNVVKLWRSIDDSIVVGAEYPVRLRNLEEVVVPTTREARNDYAKYARANDRFGIAELKQQGLLASGTAGTRFLVLTKDASASQRAAGLLSVLLT